MGMDMVNDMLNGRERKVQTVLCALNVDRTGIVFQATVSESIFEGHIDVS